MEISHQSPPPFFSSTNNAAGAGPRPARAPQESPNATQTNATQNTPNTHKARESTSTRPTEEPGKGEGIRREFGERPNANAREQVSANQRSNNEVIELRPLIVEANSSPATRAFLDVAQAPRDRFQIIDIYV